MVLSPLMYMCLEFPLVWKFCLTICPGCVYLNKGTTNGILLYSGNLLKMQVIFNGKTASAITFDTVLEPF